MPLILTQDDLRPLAERSELLKGAFDAIEAAILEHQGGESGCVGWMVHPLDTHHSAALYSTSSKRGMSLRIFPNVGFAQNVPNSHLWLLFEPKSGELLAILACDDLNTLRTAVPAGVGARYLAPRAARTLCMLGTGRQARAQIRTLLHAVPTIERVVVWSPTGGHRESYAKEMRRLFDVDIRTANTCREAVEGADIICAAGRIRGQAAFDGRWVRPGALAISATRGSQPSLDARIVVPSLKRPQALTAAGPEIASDTAREQEPLELASVIRGAVAARRKDEETLLFDLAGMYGWDTPLMLWAYDWARKNGIGTGLSLTSRKPGLFPAWIS